MNNLDWQIILPVVSLCALVVVHRFRKWMRAEDPEGYRHIVFGLAILSVTNLAPLYANAGVFALTPFISEPLFFSLVMWIMVLTGLIFLFSGIAGFVPVSRDQRRYNQEVIARLELLKEVEQLVGIESRPDAILAGILNHVAAAYPMRAGVAFRWSNELNSLSALTTVDRPPIPVEFLEGLVFEPVRFIRDPRNTLLKAATANGKLAARNLPSMILPVASSATLHGVLLFWWEKKQNTDDPSRMLLKLAAEIGARSIEANNSRDRASCKGEYCRLSAAIAQQFAPESPAKETFATVARLINSVLGSSTVTLVLKDNLGRWHRLTSGHSKAILYEKNVNYRNVSAIARQVIADECPVYYRRCHSADLVRAGEGIKKGSLMALPIKRSSKVCGAVSFVSERESAFDRFSMDLLQLTVASLGEFAWLLGREHRGDRSQRRQQLIRAFLRDSYRELSTQELFEDTARVVAGGVEADIVRVSTFGREQRFLNSRALICKHTGSSVPPSRASLLLELLRVHTGLRQGRRTLALDMKENSGAMDETEMIHMFGQKVTSTALVPINHEDDIVGVISVARLDKSEAGSFTDADITFIELAAASVSLAVRQARLDRELLSRRQRPQDATSIRSQVKSSLSGIVGSIEMIRSRGNGTDDTTDKYLGIIDRSARRLSKTVSETTE